MQYRITKLDDDTYCIEQKFLTYRCLCYLLVGRERALLIDTAFADDAFTGAVKRLCPLPLDVAITHAHLDHIGNAHHFDRVFMSAKDRGVFALHSDRAYLEGLLSTIPKAARFLLRKKLGAILDTHPELKTIPYAENHRFDLGGRTIEVIETPGHSAGSICLLERDRRRLYSGDTVCDIGILLHIEGCLSPKVFLESIRRLKALDVELAELCTGHRQSRLDPAYIEAYERCAEGIVNGTLVGTKTGKPPLEHLIADLATSKSLATGRSLGRVRIEYKFAYEEDV
ncbi:MBL fold metallo-hydrolase [Spirochaetia bacterium]|nr:MBL fold metallo-hydrolase [Spirochaetia bacterium]